MKHLSKRGVRRAILCALLPLVLSTPAFCRAGLHLVWSDDFNQPDGSSPNPTNWTFDTGAGGWGNSELENYTTRTNNARIVGGQLIIEADQESYQGSSYTSARMKTQGLQSWTYGRIEASIKIPYGQGIWPAFWTLGSDISTDPWPGCGEIDIMENIGKVSDQGTDHGTIHGPQNGGDYNGGEGVGGTYTLPGGAALSSGFHTYAVQWTPNQIQFFLDTNLYFTVTPANLPSGGTWVFTMPQFILLNVAVGGSWPGNPDGTTVFPQQMVVQYVNVYAFVTDPPTGLTATPGNDSVSLNWTAVSGATSYNVKRSTTSGAETTISPAGSVTGTNYTDSTATGGVTYYYEVSAVGANGESTNSAEVSTIPIFAIPGAPGGLTAAAFNNQVSLSWTAGVGATSYNVKRSTTSGAETTISPAGAVTGTNYTDNRGAHVLRHSLATGMLRNGASLAQIGQVLRHQLPQTTEIYAKVDFNALRALALPWPGGAL